MSKSEQYVVVSNTMGHTNMFADHRGVMRSLSPMGKANDSIQLTFEEHDDLRCAISKYEALKGVHGLRIVFSGSVPMTVHKPALVSHAHGTMNKDVADKVEFLRKQNKTDIIAQARLARIKADQSLAAQKTKEVVLEEASQIAPVIERPKEEETVASDVDTSIIDLQQADEASAVELSRENLDKMKLTELRDIASKLDIATGNRTKAELTESILNKITVTESTESVQS